MKNVYIPWAYNRCNLHKLNKSGISEIGKKEF